MPRLNIDEAARQMFEPIEFTLDGKEYSVTKIEANFISKLNNRDLDFGIFLGTLERMCEVDEGTFGSVDIRKINILADYINESITKQIEEFASKKSQEAEADQKV